MAVGDNAVLPIGAILSNLLRLTSQPGQTGRLSKIRFVLRSERGRMHPQGHGPSISRFFLSRKRCFPSYDDEKSGIGLTVGENTEMMF